VKSLEFVEYKALDKLRLIEVEKPVPNDHEVLVKIVATSINSWDWELFNATPFVNRIMFGLFKPKRLKTLGFDIAGRVVAVGADVTTFRVGDEVYGDLSSDGWGGFAEYVAAPTHALVKKPASLSFEQAAAVPQAALLALQGLRDVGHIQPGQKIMIIGASGGSGTFALQIARQYDVEITGVCSTAKMELVRTLGADHVIDYTQGNFTRSDQQYDLIIDAHSHYPLSDYKRLLKLNGIYVMHGGTSSAMLRNMYLAPILSLFGKRKFRILLHKANRGLDVMNALFNAGKVVPVIDKTFPLSEFVEAFRYYGSGQARGKVVVKIGENIVQNA
jgi:NADPH:quinone reductase-like Zn-dependent oxidoreductase